MKNINSEQIQDRVVFRPKGAKVTVEVQLKNETVWLSQKQMAELFNKDVNTIGEHTLNIFKEKELNKTSVTRKFRVTANDGKSYITVFYSLDVIISVGYRVKSGRGTEFRIWASNILKQHLIQGFIQAWKKRPLIFFTWSSRTIHSLMAISALLPRYLYGSWTAIKFFIKPTAANA